MGSRKKVAYADKASVSFPAASADSSASPLHPLQALSRGYGAAARSAPGASDSASASTRKSPTDIRLPCMVYAAIGVLPAGIEVDAALADMRKAPGVVQVIAYAGLLDPLAGEPRREVAVIARGYWLARQLLGRLLAQVGADVLYVEGRRANDDSNNEGVSRATAQFIDGRLRLWLATSDAAASHAATARLANLAPRDLDLRVLGKARDPASSELLTAAIAVSRELRPTPVQVIVTPTRVAPVLSSVRIHAVDIPTHTEIDHADVPHVAATVVSSVALAA